MSRTKKDTIYRTDLLVHGMNAGKEREIDDLLRAYQACAVLLGREQWRLYFEVGRLNKNHRNANEADLARVAGAANRVQMARYQVVGVLDSFLENRKNDFARLVQRSTLPKEVKHPLHILNRLNRIFSREPVVVKKTKEEIPVEVRRLARSLMRRVLSQHRKPNLSRINMVLDQRAVTVREAESATEFPLWARISTMTPRKMIEVPLRTHAHFEKREGRRALSVQVNRREGRLYFGIVTDISPVCAAQKEAYEPKCDEVALDFGLRTLFATDQGDLLGRRFVDHLRVVDRRITRLAAYRQKHGLRVRSARYAREVERLRGYLRTEIGRVLNRLVETHAPKRIVVERLHFFRPELSRRMNRLLNNCGRKVVQDKLDDLNERLGIEIEEQNPAYSSQECHSCGYVDKKNRAGEAFRCRWCGRQIHADVNAPRTLRSRRSWLAGRSVALAKADLLHLLVRRHVERHPRPRGRSRDPRLDNPYFSDWRAKVISNDAEQALAA
jgi:putative transposase